MSARVSKQKVNGLERRNEGEKPARGPISETTQVNNVIVLTITLNTLVAVAVKPLPVPRYLAGKISGDTA